MNSLARDLHFAFRQLRRHPAFTLACILTLAVGTGAATALFSIVDGVLLRPLPYPEPDRLVAISTVSATSATHVDLTPHDTSYLNYHDWERLNHTFSSIAAYSTVPRLFSHADGSGSRVLNETTASANLFGTLGVAPMLGRTFNSEDERPGARSAILSHELWVSDFASSRAAIGSTIRISDQPLTVVGILPAGFQFPVVDAAPVFTPVGFDPEALVDPAHTHQMHQRGGSNFSVIGRLRSDSTLGSAQTDLNIVQRALAAQYSEDRLDQATHRMTFDSAAR